jgi:DNA modification methylase
MTGDLFGPLDQDVAAIFGPGYRVYNGDMRDVLRQFPDNSMDAIFTDPPYHLTTESRYARTSLDSQTDSNSARARNPAAADGFARLARGFMGKAWDGGDVAFQPDTWRECLRVLKPGGHLIAFGGSRTYHRLAVAVEDAGFVIRDQLLWIYASGQPKSHDQSKAIDAMLGAVRPVIEVGKPQKRMIPGATQNQKGWIKDDGREFVPTVTGPGSEQAAQWEGWGTGLGPAHEPMVLARKPFIGTVAANLLQWGTGALNIDASKIGELKRWPKNVVLDGSLEVEAVFPASLGQKGDVTGGEASAANANVYNPRKRTATIRRGDQGSASRFYYHAKADKHDRAGSDHPTVKPVDLCEYFIRMICPPGGTVLDPFAGSGTSLEAARRIGLTAVGIEMDPTYFQHIRNRLA